MIKTGKNTNDNNRENNNNNNNNNVAVHFAQSVLVTQN